MDRLTCEHCGEQFYGVPFLALHLKNTYGFTGHIAIQQAKEVRERQMTMAPTYDELRSQRDALLAALDEIAETCQRLIDETDIIDPAWVVQTARAAIAAARTSAE